MNKVDIELFTWVKDKEGRFLSCSENMAQLAGAESPLSLIGKSDLDMPWRDRHESYLEEEYLALRGQQCKRYQRQKTVEGNLTILVTKSPLLKKNGEVIGTVGASIDLTNKKICDIAEGYVDSQGCLQLGTYYCDERLTKREVTILKYILKGYTAARTAAQLSISRRTVESHVDSIKRKLQCISKGEIIETATKLGLVFLFED